MEHGLLPLLFTFVTNNVGNYASLYFYSALFQGNAALITLSAMFVIYKSQSLENEFMKKEEMLVSYFKSSFNVALNYGTIWAFENYIEGMFPSQDGGTKEKIKKLIESDHWKTRFTEMRNVKNEIEGLWKAAAPSLIGIFSALVLSIILLPFSDSIHKNGNFEISIFILVIILEVYSIRKLYLFIKKQLATR